MKKVLFNLTVLLLSGLYASAQTDAAAFKQAPYFYTNAQKDTSTAIQSSQFLMGATADTFTTIQLPNFYTNTITTGLYSSNNRSGTIYQSNASINYGLMGPKVVGFKFRWLAHDNGSVDYTTDTDQIMYLDNSGNLGLKGSLTTTAGNVGIGTADTKGYRLAVNGDAVFTRIKVKAFSNWPDYVFDKAYKLMPLQDVEIYVKQHNHLPDVPSAQEVAKEGIDVAEMNKVLLQKIEELTLHVIEQEKKLAAQQQQIDQLIGKGK